VTATDPRRVDVADVYKSGRLTRNADAVLFDDVADLPFDQRTGHKVRRSIEYRCRRFAR
jgi:hypothetical protein